jgi:hypothetical protein
MHSACAASPATRARTAAHAPRKQGGRQPYGLLAWLPMLTSRRLLLLSRCLAGRDPKQGAAHCPSRLERVSRLSPYASLRITGQQEKGRQY